MRHILSVAALGCLVGIIAPILGAEAAGSLGVFLVMLLLVPCLAISLAGTVIQAFALARRDRAKARRRLAPVLPCDRPVIAFAPRPW